MTAYTARVQRGDRFWLVTVPKISRSTQAQSFCEIELMARDLVAEMEQIGLQSFDLEYQMLAGSSEV